MFDYKVVVAAQGTVSEEDLNLLGIERWALVAVVPNAGGVSSTFYFKRPSDSFVTD